MQAAKDAAASYIKGDGRQVTEVDEQVNPAVVNETIKPHRHEETQEAVDREIHQDHYHTTIQPVQDRAVLPEAHTHTLAPQIERQFEHGDREQDRARAGADLAQFQNTSRTTETTSSADVAPAVTGEHVHHHVHEVVQPIIHKETIQPEVVHTTIPIHEKHHAPSELHGMSVLPAKTLGDFQNMGGDVTGGRSVSHTEYDGHPKGYNPDLQVEQAPIDKNPSAHEGNHDPHSTGHDGYLGSQPPRVVGDDTSGSRGLTGSSNSGYGTTGSSGLTDTGRTGISTSTGGMGTSTDTSTFGSGNHGNSSAMGSGVAGVAAGSVAQDLGRDHTRADQVSDLNPRDTPSTFGDSGSNTVGTALGGRAEGNTASYVPVTEDAHMRGTANNYSDNANLKDEPTNLSSGVGGLGSSVSRDDDSSNRLGSNTTHPDRPSGVSDTERDRTRESRTDDDVQHATRQGEDPSLAKDKTLEKDSGKLTGSGADGSHSAVFGLTPDGHKYDDTAKHPGSSPPVDSAKDNDKRESAMGGGKLREDGDADMGSRGTGTEGNSKVAEQMQDLNVGSKGHAGQGTHQGDNDTKPGFGADTSKIV